MADDDKKLSWRAIKWGSISSILCLDNGGRGVGGCQTRKQKFWGEEIMPFGKCGSGEQAIIRSSSLLRPYWLPSKNEQRLLVWANKEWLCWGKHQRQKKTGMTHYIPLCSVCVCVFHSKKNIPKLLESSNSNDCPRLPCSFPRVNTGCECDMLGQTCSHARVLFCPCSAGCEVSGCW